MLISHRIALDPNNGQATYFARAAGTARFAWNWALAEWRRQYTARKADPSLPAPSEAALRRRLNAIKAEQFPWMMEVTKNAPQQAIKNVGAAFQRFFAKQGKYPRFKRKGVAIDPICGTHYLRGGLFGGRGVLPGPPFCKPARPLKEPAS